MQHLTLNTALSFICLSAMIVSIALFVTGCSKKAESQAESSELTNIRIGTKEFLIEVADTPDKRQQGLSGRDEIGSDGVLFVFESAKTHPFWMKDMKFDLDFIWIQNGKVVEITERVPRPMFDDSTDSELPIYRPKQPIEMMLEVPAGFVQQEGIQVGDPVQFEKGHE